MADKNISPSTFEQFNSLSQLHFVRQIIFMILMACGIALSTVIVMWARDGNFVPLYMSLTPVDSTEIVTALEQTNTKYRINSSTGIISVPESEMEQVRLQLASQGLPRNSSVGYEILSEEQSLNTSNFMEQARFNHALEQELVHTIRYIRSVRDARVHLSIPKQSSFLRDSNKPSASVMLNLVEGQRPGSTQLAGIIHLVASSVAGLSPENVSIVDQYGNLLSQNGSGDFEQSAENLRIIREVEQEYTRKILEILSPVVGLENVHAQVSADIDFTTIETTTENFDPATTTVRSEQIQEERGQITESAPVQPGTLSPFPPDTEANTNPQPLPQTTLINATRNFEVDHSVSFSRNIPGSVNRLTVAVLVDLDGAGVGPEPPVNEADSELEPEGTAAQLEEEQQRLERLSQLVRDTIGFNQARGDSVNVINEQFALVETVEFTDTSSFMDNDWILPVSRQVLAGIVVLILIFFVLRPALKTAVSSASNLPKRIGSSGQISEVAGGTADSMSNDLSAPELNQIVPKKSQYDQNLEMARHVVQSEPVRAARMIKEWVANG